MKNMKQYRYMIALAAIACWLLAVGCDDSDGDRLRGLGDRVEYLEDEILKLNRMIQEQDAALAEIRLAVENGD